jgi:predicted RecB family nuclease
MIHVSLLQDYLQCETKSYLRFRGRSGQATEYSMLCAQLDARHRANAFKWLAAQSTTAGVRQLNGSRVEDLTTGHAMILDAMGGADGLETHFHGLQRVPGDSRLGPYSYRPIRVYRHLQPNSVVRLLLAFDALILSHLQGLSPDDGVLVCGPNFRRIRVHLQTYRESLTTILTRPRGQIAGINEPLLAAAPDFWTAG